MKNRVHFWLHELSAARAQLDALKDLVSAEERLRAEKMQSFERAEVFLLSRGILRRHLGERLAAAPQSLRIVVDDKGKPSLADGGISFSLSHSHDRLLIGIDSSGSPLGVDLQFDELSVDFELLARHLYSETEKANLAKVSGKAKRDLALRYWCIKEALFKMGSAGETAECIDGRFGDYGYAACFTGNVDHAF